MNTPKVSHSGKNYFYKVIPRKWNFREAFSSYQSTLNLSSETIRQIMATDLTLIGKSQINDDDAEKLKDLFVTVISPHSDDDILECTRQEYEVNMEEQRVLHCFRKKSRTFDLLEICLDGSLNELMDRIDEIKANVEDNDDEKQNIRLLRYILPDYHANCTKPS
ncbi:hypothetical protein INT45_009918 [Circinella minor]|uniref:Uncharacterized protein n=1 Tax=Circinella minor TaxID=1195481 RepID=A0A8H7VH72_9FUNG|nr:hypothetical protein INT45_009918 [Circinella minor]